MGYSCPVCGDPQADDQHLANHLAFTAMIRGGDHETFLDEHVPDWESLGEDDLGDVITEMAAEEEYPQVFEDTTDPDRGHQHAHDHAHEDENEASTGPSEGHGTPLEEDLSQGGGGIDSGALDEVPEDVLAEARELTRKRHAADEDPEEDTDQ